MAIFVKSFKEQWMNFGLYFTQFGYMTKKKNSKSRVCGELIEVDDLFDNGNPLGGGEVNTKFFARGDFHQTDFIEVNKEDFIKIIDISKNKSGFTMESNLLKGSSYKKLIESSDLYKNSKSNSYYFFTGLFDNIVRILLKLNIL